MHKSLKKYVRRPFPFALQDSVLLVIDMQKFFLDKNSHAFVPMAPAIIPRVRRLIQFYRRQKRPVIFTREAVKKNEDPGMMKRWWRDVIREGTPQSRIIAQLKPLEQELVIRKTQYSAFYKTGLDKILKRDKIKRVVVTGVMTHLCCETTARDAFMRGYEVFFVADGNATDNQDLHLSTLKTLADGFAIPVATREILCSSL
jgi:isochorismate hydrolase